MTLLGQKAPSKLTSQKNTILMQVQDLAEKVGRSVEAEICPKKKNLGKSTPQKTIKAEEKGLACFEKPHLGRISRSLRFITEKKILPKEKASIFINFQKL